MKTRFFDVHCFYNRKDGFSVFLKTILTDDFSEDDVIKAAFIQGLISDEDSGQVDYVAEITEEEYVQAK